MSETRRRGKASLKDYAAVYALFVVILVLAYASFWVWRQALTLLLQVFLPGNFANRSIILFSMLFITMGLFIAVLASEAYLRTAVEGRRGGQLGRRFLRLALPLVGFCVVGLLLRIFALAVIG